MNHRRRLLKHAGKALVAAAASTTGATDLANAHQLASKTRTGWVYDDAYLTPVFPSDHPEQPARVAAIARAINTSPIQQRLARLQPQSINTAVLDRAIRLIHTPAHIESLDARYDPAIMRLARMAVGGTLTAINAVQTRRLENVFVCARPPGHHARNTGREEGFCFFNQVAIAARYAQLIHGVRRVLIVDWDYHHGDGTEHFFYEDASILLFNTYDPAAYPRVGDPARKGAGAGLGNNINVPLPCGAGDADFERVFSRELVPAAERFKPELILISCGFDSRIGDLLGCFNITDHGYRTLTRIVMDIAHRHCQGKIVSILEGGYNLNGLASASLMHLGTMLDYHSK